MSEHLHQKALFEWADRMEGAWPELRLMYAIPNGGLRTKAQAGKLKAEGVKPGVPDIHLPVARCGYHGLYVEMKFGDGNVSPAQRAWHASLKLQGHAVETCWCWDDAADTIAAYLKGCYPCPPSS